MKDGKHFPLTQPQMILKNTSEVFREAAKQLGHGDDAVLNLLKVYHALQSSMAPCMDMTTYMWS